MLRCTQGVWKVTGEEEMNFSLYRQTSYPLGRRQEILLTPKLLEVEQDDVWI